VLNRNVLISDEKGFKGNWVAVPIEDFDAAKRALDIADTNLSLAASAEQKARLQRDELVQYIRDLTKVLVQIHPNLKGIDAGAELRIGIVLGK
jgi:hypothetical protein